MEKDELIARLDCPMNFQMVMNLTAINESSNIDLEDLLEISFNKKKEIAFRAAWLLEHVVTHSPLRFWPHIETFLLLLPKQTNLSAMRHYAKIVVLLTGKKSSLLYKEALSRIDMEPAVETLFTWLVEQNTPVAIKVNCMQALANLTPQYDWIKAELLETMNHLSEVESYAFFARAKMVRKQLKSP